MERFGSGRRGMSYTEPPRVGMFGLLGSGNIGNDGTFEVLLAHVADRHPGARIDCMCAGPVTITERYGLPAHRLHWDDRVHDDGAGVVSLIRKASRIGIGLVCDAWRTLAWVHRHDVILVPGMGTLEGTLRHRPWEMPYSLFLLSLGGRLFDVKVALVCVGASPFPPGLTRRMMAASARMAHLRSYRDEYSRAVVHAMGIDVSRDEVFQDLVHARPEVGPPRRTNRVVGLGVMAYYGDNSDRHHADDIHTAYVEKITEFAQWLVTDGYRVRLLIGDQDDEPVAHAVLHAVTAIVPGACASITYEPASTMDVLLQQIGSVDLMVATRYHNVLCALHCRRPTISLGYGAKHHELMTQMSLPDFSLSVRTFEPQELMTRFKDLETNSVSLARTIGDCASRSTAIASAQLDDLDEKLFGTGGSSTSTNRSS